MDKLIDNITAYLEYLTNECKLEISVHFSGNTLKLLPPDIHTAILKFNSHNNAYCVSVKGKNHAKCIHYQKSIIDEQVTQCRTCTCHAGVLEYIFPVISADKSIGYIAVSGYKGENPPASKKDLRLWKAYLFNGQIPKALCDAVIPPLQIMLGQLFRQFTRETSNEYNKIVQFLNEYHTNITLDSLCRHFGRSKSYVSHMFKRESGLSIRAYCNNLKLRDAARMLKDTDMPITDIAFDTGFCDVSYFIALFKKSYGVSPLKFRKKSS